MRIGINCGHTVDGQPGSGAIGYISESAETRNVGRALMTLLHRGGHTVYDCTNDYASSTNENLSKIVAMANAQPLDLFVSIHFNSGGGRGTEVYTYGAAVFQEAENVCKNIAELGFRNRGIKDGTNLYVINKTSARAMLIEICFVDTDDAQVYMSVGAENIARAIYRAITGQDGGAEYTEVSDIIRCLADRGIITDTGLWTDYCERDSNVYWFCRKLCAYLDTKKPESESDEYVKIHDIAWDLQYRGVITDIALWERMMERDSNVYWLLRKGLHYCRTH